MLSLVRGGTREIFLKLKDWGVIDSVAVKFPLVEKKHEDAWDSSSEGQTLIFATMKGRSLGEIRVFLADSSPGEILAFMLNEGLCDKLGKASVLPRTILFRVSGDYSEVMEQMRQDFDAKVGKIPLFLRWTDSGGRVAVMFTRNNLNRPIAIKDLFPDVLYIQMPYEQLLRNLRSRAMSYFNEARGHADWRSLEIRVYDMWERYPLQAKRLRLVLDELEIGLVLGEGRGKDFAHILMPVPVYRFHLATFLEPERIKEILMGMEYSASGKRLVDLDLFEGKKKTGWGAIAEKDEDRERAGVRLRKQLMEDLLPSTRDQLARIEEEIEGEERG